MRFFPKRAKDSRKIDNIALKDLDISDVYPIVPNCKAFTPEQMYAIRDSANAKKLKEL